MHMSAAEIARQLRLRATDIDRVNEANRVVCGTSGELRTIADTLDGGTGAHVHRGCANPDVLVANCVECHMVEQAELDDPERLPSVFTPVQDAEDT